MCDINNYYILVGGLSSHKTVVFLNIKAVWLILLSHFLIEFSSHLYCIRTSISCINSTVQTTFEILEDISTFLPQPTSQNLVDYEGM